MGGNGQTPGTPGGLSPEEFQRFLEMQQQATINWIAMMAGVNHEIAQKCLFLSAQQSEGIQEFLASLLDEKRTAEHPVFGIRLHYPGGKKYTNYMAPKHPPKLIGGRWVSAQDSDLGSYMAILGMLTSIEGRAIMAAQGYRIEFLHVTKPKGW